MIFQNGFPHGFSASFAMSKPGRPRSAGVGAEARFSVLVVVHGVVMAELQVDEIRQQIHLAGALCHGGSWWI